MISCHLRDIGGCWSTVAYICYRGIEPWGNVTGGRAESMCRLTHVIPSVPIKDRTVVGASTKIEHMPLSWPNNSFRLRSRVAQLRPGPVL